MTWKTIKKTVKIYAVDWYYGDYCYRTTTGCTWEDVQDLRRQAKNLGETVKWTVIGTKTYEY
jgi:hypothetical protein